MIMIRIKTRSGRNNLDIAKVYSEDNLREMSDLYAKYVKLNPRKFMLVVWWED